MGLKFNPFTSNFDFDTVGSTTWLSPVPTRASLPTGDPDGAARIVLDEDTVFVYDLAADEWHNTRLSLTQFSALANASGITIDSVVTAGKVDYRINLHPADSTNPGGVSTGAQSFSGDKTFNNNVIITGNLTVNGTTTSVNSNTLDVVDANITVNNTGNQASANLNAAGITVSMTDAVDARIGYDSALTSRFKIGEIGTEAEIADVSSAQLFTNKNLKSSTNLLTGASADSFKRETGNLSLFTIPDSVSNDNFVLEAFAQTLSNKTLDNTNTIISLDTGFTLQDNVDNTKQAQFRVDLIPTATTNTYDLPTASDVLLGETNTQSVTNKTIDATLNTITNIADAEIKALAGINATKIADGSIDNIEFQALNGVTSNIQTQLDGKVDGPATATNNAIARYDLTTGKLIKDSLVLVDDLGNIKNLTDPVANQDAATKKYVDDNTTFVIGDLDQVSFSMANNQLTPADVTGVLFSNASVRSAEIQYSVTINATTNLYESGKIQAVQRGADWVITQSSNGDNSQVLFSMTSLGQLQYTSGNIAGFTSGVIKCRALVTSV